MIRVFCKYTVRFLISIFYRHKIYGKENLLEGGGIIAPNHTSFLDPPIIGASSPGAVHFLAKETLFDVPFLGWLIRKLKTHPVKKGKGNAAIFRMTMELVKEGKKVVLFPEGKRSSEGILEKGQLGIGMLVYRTGCRVFPVYIHGAFEAWNTERRFPKLFGKTACVFGQSLDFADLIEGDKKEIQEKIVIRIMEKIAILRDWYLAGADSPVP